MPGDIFHLKFFQLTSFLGTIYFQNIHSSLHLCVKILL